MRRSPIANLYHRSCKHAKTLLPCETRPARRRVSLAIISCPDEPFSALSHHVCAQVSLNTPSPKTFYARAWLPEAFFLPWSAGLPHAVVRPLWQTSDTDAGQATTWQAGGWLAIWQLSHVSRRRSDDSTCTRQNTTLLSRVPERSERQPANGSHPARLGSKEFIHLPEGFIRRAVGGSHVRG